MTKKKAPRAKPVRHRIIVVDDHALIRRGLVAMINNEPDLEVCAEAGTRVAGLAVIASSRPDMVTVDLSLGESDGLELIKDIRVLFPALPVLVISMHNEVVYAERTFRAGARGYVTKDQMDGTVLVAIRCVLTGGQYMSPKLGAWFAQQYLAGHPREKDSPTASLSDRELEVFRMIGEGKTTRQVAIGLKLSIKTIESYREHLKQKLTLDSGAELARSAARWVETSRIS
jgi:DNA-binding NarL/FixJ family response regulator